MVGSNLGRWLVSGPKLGLYDTPDLSFRWGLHIHHGCNLEKLLCSPWEDDGQQWRWLRARRLSSSSTSMSAASGAPPARRSSPTASLWAPLAPWPLNCLREVANQAHVVTFSLRYGSDLWAKFNELGPLYIGLLVPTHRGFGILTNLSPTRFRIVADKANLSRG
jgi:hypothetical protein